MVYKGDTANVGFSFESEDTEYDTVFTPGAQTGMLGIISSAELVDSPAYTDQGSTGSRDQYIAPQGKFSITGTLPVDLQNGRLFYLAMGTTSDTGSVGGGLYGHTVTGKNTGHIPSMVMEALYAGSANFLRVYRGVKVGSLQISGNEGDGIMASVSLQACKSRTSSATPSVYTAPEENAFMFKSSTLTFDGSEFNTTGFTWQINNNLAPYWTTRAYFEQYPYLLQERQRYYNLGCSIILEDSSSASKFYDNLKSGALADASIVMRNGSKTIEINASDCTIRNSPHLIPEVGQEVEIQVIMVPKTCTVSTVDEINSYSTF